MPSFEAAQVRVGMSLEGAAAFMHGRASQIMQELDELKRTLAPLIETWQAQSATAYQELQQQWDAAATGLLGTREQGGVLGEIAYAMGVNWDNYEHAEMSARQSWQNSPH